MEAGAEVAAGRTSQNLVLVVEAGLVTQGRMAELMCGCEALDTERTLGGDHDPWNGDVDEGPQQPVQGANHQGGVERRDQIKHIDRAWLGFQLSSEVEPAMQPAGGRHTVSDSLLIGPRHPSVRLLGARQQKLGEPTQFLPVSLRQIGRLARQMGHVGRKIGRPLDPGQIANRLSVQTRKAGEFDSLHAPLAAFDPSQGCAGQFEMGRHLFLLQPEIFPRLAKPFPQTAPSLFIIAGHAPAG